MSVAFSIIELVNSLHLFRHSSVWSFSRPHGQSNLIHNNKNNAQLFYWFLKLKVLHFFTQFKTLNLYILFGVMCLIQFTFYRLFIFNCFTLDIHDHIYLL